MSIFLCLLAIFAGFFGNEGTEFRIFREPRIFDDVPEYPNGWFGLFATDSIFEMRSVAFDLRESAHKHDEWESPEPLLVELHGVENWPMIVIGSSVVEFHQGFVPSAWSVYTDLAPGDSISLIVAGVTEALLFTTEYGLFLQRGDTYQHVSTTSPENPNSGSSIALCWAGDIDRDGEIDLITNDIDDPYFWLCWRLYLSSEAEHGLLVKQVASYWDVYY